MLYDCIIIGGGIAGLQTAIQLGRYQYKVLVIDANNGRSNLCRSYHNLLGWPEGVSGETLRNLGKQQAQTYNVQFLQEVVSKVEKKNETFSIHIDDTISYKAKRLLLATGIQDNIPPFPELYPCLGISMFICPDCDGYEIANKPAIVLGSGNSGANMALTLTHWSKKIIYINHGQKPIDQNIQQKLHKRNIPIHNERIKNIHTSGPHLKGVTLQSEQTISVDYGFLAFGGNQVNVSLASQLGVELLKNNHIQVDHRTKMTNIEHVWAAGDIVAHSEQVAIAMGDGVQAAIWIHKSLLKEE